MLKFNRKELNFLYEGISELLKDENSSFTQKEIETIINLQEKLKATGKLDNVLNENVQLLDKIIYDKARGYVTGQIGDKMIVMIQGSTYLVDPRELKEFNTKIKPEINSQFKFDNITQKLLFEQYVKCGIYQNSVPIKTQNCYVRYDKWQSAKSEDKIQVLIEGEISFMDKENIRIFEDVNDFANPENYVEGVLIDQGTGAAVENILVNALDYTNTVGDADSVKIIRKTLNGEQEIQTVPKGMVKTLAI